MALELTIDNVDAGYGAVRALHGVSLEAVFLEATGEAEQLAAETERAKGILG